MKTKIDLYIPAKYWELADASLSQIIFEHTWCECTLTIFSNRTAIFITPVGTYTIEIDSRVQVSMRNDNVLFSRNFAVVIVIFEIFGIPASTYDDDNFDANPTWEKLAPYVMSSILNVSDELTI